MNNQLVHILGDLDDNNIKYIREYKFNNCKYINELRFDFYLPDYNICIEYNGKQHYMSIEFFGGIDKLNKQIINDKIKVKYCNNNNIQLIVIKYNEDIEEKLLCITTIW